MDFAVKDKDDSIAAIMLDESRRVYRPIVKIFLQFVAIYYVIVTFNHFTSEIGLQLYIMVALSVGSALTAFWYSRKLDENSSLRRIEFAGLLGNLILLVNLIYFYTTQYDSDRLVYFVLMVFIFAMTGSTSRLIIVSVIAALASLYTTIWIYEPSLMQHYLYIGVASTLAGLGSIMFLRRVIADALRAKVDAAQARAEAVDAAAQATALSTTDALTSLPNRRAFFQYLNARTQSGSGGDPTLAVLLIDLDGFKPINDSYGHGVGDRLLIAVGERLQAHIPDRAYISRIGGDEFAVVMSVTSPEDARKAGDHLCLQMRSPFYLGGTTVHVGATIGVATRSEKAKTASSLVENADFALFNTKRTLKGTCALFTARDARVMKRAFVVEQALRSGNLEEELEVLYQPQFDTSHNRVSSFEALARWNSKTLGEVAPDIFIQVAETSGLIKDITRVLLTKAMTQVAAWPVEMDLSFNLSVHDVLDTEAIDRIIGIVTNADVDPSRICFEITETVMMGDFEKASAALQKLVDAGYKVALDDFGTGYSSFTYLHKLPIHKIKIDRSFVRGLGGKNKSAQIISTILHLSRSLDKECIVEGVETEIEFTAMQSLGARFIQGYFFGKPLPAADARTLIEEGVANASDPSALSV